MRKKRPPFGHVVWRGTSKGRPVVRAVCPHCASEHRFSNSPMVKCPRTGLWLSLRMRTVRKKAA